MMVVNFSASLFQGACKEHYNYISILRIFGVCGQLPEEIRLFFKDTSATAYINKELSESFSVCVDVRQGCITSLWLFDSNMVGCMREVKVIVGNSGEG